MTDERSYLDYLEDILAAIDAVAEFIEGMAYEDFENDRKTAFAVVRAMEIVGEAAKAIPVAVRQRFPDVPWRQMARMRDKLIHHYVAVNLRVVWMTATKDLPAMAPRLRQILSDSSGGG